MEPRKRKNYDADFKRQAVEFAESSGRSDAVLEREMGLYDGALRYWRREMAQHAQEAFPGKGKVPGSEEELRHLRREIEILRQERDILKKAVAIFSLPPRIGTDS